jgi:cobalt-zinc-cadmium efflux system outer membrane protein
MSLPRRFSPRFFIVGVGLFIAAATSARAVEVDVNVVIELARARSAEVLRAERGVDEAAAELEGAEVLLTENPTIDGVIGPRFGRDATLLEAGVDVSVPLQIYGERGLRIDAAERAIAREKASLEDARRRATGEGLAIYFNALHARALRTLADERANLSAELLEATLAKRKAGDLGDLDVSVVALEDARARRARLAAVSEERGALAGLAVFLGIADVGELVLKEDLRAASGHFRSSVSAAGERADVRAAALAEESAAAALAAEERAAWPVVSLVVGYEHEELENVGLVGFSVPLGFFERNQGAIAAARARRKTTEVESAIVRRTASAEAEAARRRLQSAREGVDVLEGSATARIDEGVALIRKAYGLGERGLTDVLLIQRETLDAKADIQAAYFELGLAGAVHLSATGATQ